MEVLLNFIKQSVKRKLEVHQRKDNHNFCLCDCILIDTFLLCTGDSFNIAIV